MMRVRGTLASGAVLRRALLAGCSFAPTYERPPLAVAERFPGASRRGRGRPRRPPTSIGDRCSPTRGSSA